MLDKESMDTYRSIHLNRDLRCEILQRRENKASLPLGRYMRPAAMLASAVLVIGILLLYPFSGSAPLTVNGHEIGKKAEILSTESVEYSGGIMRMAFSGEDTLPLQQAQVCVPLKISAGQDVFITVSGGSLLLPDPSGILTFAGQSGPAPDGVTVYVSLEGCESSSPVILQISDSEGVLICSYRLAYLTDHAAWQISHIKQ